MTLSQTTRLLGLQTPLGADELLLTAFRGHAAISQLFCFQLEMISDNSAVVATDIVGKNVTFSIKLADNSPRFFNGFVSRFAAGDEDDQGRRNYRAEVVPWLWFLTRTRDCRIFQRKKVPDILEQVFADLGFSDYQLQLTGTHAERDYCVQYRETDFQFVARLMEEEGICYFFQHESGKHTLVLADHAGAYFDCQEQEVDYPRDIGSRAIRDHLTNWEHRYEFRTGKYAQTDYDFEKPSNDLMTHSKTVVDLPGNDKYEFYDYPGRYAQTSHGRALTDIRMEEEEVGFDTVQAGSLCRTFTPGGKFKVKQHRAGSEEGKGYVITSIEHVATEPLAYETGAAEGFDYRNTFRCIPDSVVYRPAQITPKPLVQGPQTAVVVGPSGEEIYTDKYGRVKVQFYWDREGKRDENSSCWIRVAHNVAGKKWGFMTIPRIGQEVVVEFLEGDPDRPLVIGSVYNAEQMPHYQLPEEQTKAYVKTNSSKGGDGFNEVRFEDKKDKEQIFVHAQRNMDTRVRADSMESVVGDRHLTVGSQGDAGKTGDQYEMVFRDKHATVHRNHAEHIGGDMQLTVGGIDGPGNQDVVIKKDKKELIEGESHLQVNGSRSEGVDGTQSLHVGMDQHERVGMSHALDAGVDIHLKAGMNVVIEAGMSVTLKAGGGFIVVGPAGVMISGVPLLLNSGGAPGVGAGANPNSPEIAKEAAPDEPVAADDAKTGQKSASQ